MITTETSTPPRLTRKQGEALVTRWRESGTSPAAFCRASGIPVHRLRRWIKLSLKADRGTVAGGAVGFGLVIAGSGVRIRTAGGAAIEVDGCFDGVLLRRVVEALC